MALTMSLLLSYLALSPLIPSVVGSSPKALSLNFEVRRDKVSASSIKKRDIYSLDLKEDVQGYWANITLGDPPQYFTLHVDTGSSDTWVPSVDSNTCHDNEAACQITGQYDMSKSKTARELDSNFTLRYSDQSNQTGKFVSETIAIAHVSFDDYPVGVSTQSNHLVNLPPNETAAGILGLGYPRGETNVINDVAEPYPNIVDRFAADGVIETRAYSIWVDSSDSSTAGSILFGAVDKSKYTGKLRAAPIVEGPSDKDFNRTAIQLTDLYLTDESGKSSLFPRDTVALAMLDTGSTYSYMPKAMLDQLYASAGVLYSDETLGSSVVPCDLYTANANFTFGFGATIDGPQITVPMSQLVSRFPIDITFEDGTPACNFGIGVHPDGLILLGDSFLRSAYAVFDLENDRIALAQSVAGIANPENEHVVPIVKGADGIPELYATATAIPWPQSYIDAYERALPNGSEVAAPDASSTSISISPTATSYQIPAPRPEASFTAETSSGPTPTSTQSSSSDSNSAGVMDLKVTTGVLSLGFTMAAAATILGIFAL